MIDWSQRCTLAASRHVGSPQVEGHVDAGLAGERRSVANLHGQAPLGRVQHRLAVKPDDIAAIEVTMGVGQVVVLANHNPQTGLEAKFSEQFAMAAAVETSNLDAFMG